MAPKNSFHATEIRGLRTEIEEKDAEIARLKAALEKANENKENAVNIEAITKKIRDEVWLVNRNKVAALEKEHREEMAAYKKENADLIRENAALKSKIQFQEKRIEEWKHIGDKTAGPARVHQQLRQEEANHAKTKEKVRQLEAKVREHAQILVDQKKMDLMCDNLHITIMEKQETIKNLTALIQDLQFRAQLHNTEILKDYPSYMGDSLRQMMTNGEIAMVVRVNAHTYDLVIKSGISKGIPHWLYFNYIAKAMGIDVDKVLVTMPINGNHYSVVVANSNSYVK
jgi:hypothetical protein